MKEVTVWDWPIRLCHWLMVLLFSGLIFSGRSDEDYMEWHFYMGYALSALLIARLIYGFIGSKYARFSTFVVGPKKVFNYLMSFLRKEKQVHISHNPLGALMVVVLLLLLCVQWMTGLVNSDDVFWFGPLSESIDVEWQIVFAEWHYLLPDILLVLVALHISAVFFHEIALKERLVKAMLTGKKELPKSEAPNETIRTPRLGVVISLGVSLIWLLWLLSLPI